MTFTKKSSHVHKYVQKQEKHVLLSSYRSEKGKMEYTSTTGKDVLKQRVCSCGDVETYDLIRTVV